MPTHAAPRSQLWRLPRAGGCVFIKSMRSRRPARTSIGLSPAGGLLLLSALWAVDWLRTDLIPRFGAETLPPAQSQAALFTAFVAVSASITLARRVSFPRGRHAWECAGIGVGLFVVPAVLAACAEGWVSKLDQVAVFSLTPVFAVVLEPYLQGGETRQGKAALAGALAAFVGILLLFPLDIPGSFRAGLALSAVVAAAVVIAATNCLAVRLAYNIASGSILPMASLACGACAICFAAAAAVGPHTAWRWSALPTQFLGLLLIDLPALFLLFWLMGRLGASRMTARFLLAPLFAILAGLALEPTSPPARGWLGMAFLAGGAGWILFAPSERNEVGELSLLSERTADLPRRPPTDS